MVLLPPKHRSQQPREVGYFRMSRQDEGDFGGEPTSRARAEDCRFETDGAATCPLASRDRDMRPVTSTVALRCQEQTQQ